MAAPKTARKAPANKAAPKAAPKAKAKGKTTPPGQLVKPAPRTRVTGTERETFAAQVREQYNSGMPIRAIADIHGRSYGNIHRMLRETGTAMRPRGGSRA